MSPADTLAAAAAYFGMKSVEFAQFSAGVLAAFGGACAAWAAWRSSRATEASVEEMREARLQAVRPQLSVEIDLRTELIWSREEGLSIKATPHADGQRDGVKLRIRNIGGGPARDLNITLDARKVVWRRGTRHELQAISESHGGHFSSGSDGAVVNGPGSWSKLSIQGSVFRGEIELCPSGESVDWPVPDCVLMHIVLGELAHQDNSKDYFSVQLPVSINHNSLSNERRRDQFFLSVHGANDIELEGGQDQHFGLKYLRGPWNSLVYRFGVSVSRSEHRQPEYIEGRCNLVFWALFGNRAALDQLTNTTRRMRQRRYWRARRAMRLGVRHLIATFQ
jgi:hypothetical protein